MEMSASNCEHSAVFSSLPLAIRWLRDRVQKSQSVRFQVSLITLENREYLIRQYMKFNIKLIIIFEIFQLKLLDQDFFYICYKSYKSLVVRPDPFSLRSILNGCRSLFC